MTIFRNYLRVQKKHLPVLIMYTAICVAISVLISVLNAGGGSTFTSTEGDVAVINQDGGCLSEAFVDYIRTNDHLIDIGSSENDQKDAVFERKVGAVITIPEDFGEKLAAGESPELKIMTVPDSANGAFMETRYGRYVNLLKMYIGAGFSEKEAVKAIGDSMNSEIDVNMADESSTQLENLGSYYNFVSYGIMASLLYGIGLSMAAFRRKAVFSRTAVSGIRPRSLGAQLLAANLVFSLLVGLLFFVIACLLYRDAAVSKQGLLMAGGMLVFTLCTAALAYMFGSFLQKKEAVSGIANVFALGSAFLCGAFVPQELLGKTVLGAARVLPAYWYIAANDRMEKITDTGGADLSFYGTGLLVMALFGAAFLIAAAAIQKRMERGQ